jgi:syntaxin 5
MTNMSRDRSNEFFQTVTSLQTQAFNAQYVNQAAQQPQKTAADKSTFSQAAKHVLAGILTTSNKLEQLVLLAKEASIYNDVTPQINQLQYVLKNDIQTIRGEIGLLQQYATETKQTRRNTDADTSNQAVVLSLQTKLASTTQTLKSALLMTTDNLKSQYSRKQQFQVPSEGGSSSSKAGQSSNSRKGARKRRNPYFQNLLADSFDDEDSIGDTQPLLNALAVTQQQQQEQQQDRSMESYMSAHADAVTSIQDSVQNLSSVYQDLIEIVDRENEVVIRIDDNVRVSAENVREGSNQLRQYLNSMSGNQWLVLKVFAILITFSVFFVGVIA